ncbi:TPA: nucleotidyltransferase domain-containing protein [Candidatus Micrarchaeota archaeon]|nr:nucleotidyltransferase domain-containing protein [Candidatus Micrarchaeota archaeon]
MRIATKDNVRVIAFLSEFTSVLTSKFPKGIDFILLFGSAARGEFRAGISDVDLIIQVKNESDMEMIETYSESVFWKLDEKYKTRLAEICSTKQSDIFGSVEKSVKLYKPFEVIGPNHIDWKNCSITTPSLGVLASIAPAYQFAKKIKAEGKIIYGRNMLSEITVPFSFIDKIKGAVIPILISIASILVCLPFPDKGLKYGLKAVLYSVDDQLYIIDSDYKKKAALNLHLLRSELGEYGSVRLAKEALYAKKNFDQIKKEWTYADKISFCGQALIFILYNNLLSFLRFFAKVLNRFPNR